MRWDGGISFQRKERAASLRSNNGIGVGLVAVYDRGGGP
jgi:hypothetical protein